MSELGTVTATPSGTPQGAILSPVLANVALSVLDRHFEAADRRALGEIKHRIKTLTKTTMATLSPAELTRALTPKLRGWTASHRHGAAKRCFGYLSYYLWWRVIRWLRRKYPHLTWKQIKRRYWGRNWTSPEGRRLHWPAEVPVTRYRGRRNPSPWAA